MTRPETIRGNLKMKMRSWNLRRFAFPVALLLTGLAAIVGAQAQSASPGTRSLNQVAISPDGNRVAWVQSSENVPGEPTGGSAIYVQDLRSSTAKPKRISAGGDSHAANEDTIAWSPDSKHLVFLSDAEGDGQSNFYVVNVEGGSARKLTDLKGYLTDPTWSPDEKTIAFLFTENAPRARPDRVPGQGVGAQRQRRAGPG